MLVLKLKCSVTKRDSPKFMIILKFNNGYKQFFKDEESVMLTYTIISYTKLYYLMTYIYWWKGITNGLDFKWLSSSEKALKPEEMLHILESVNDTLNIYNKVIWKIKQ